MTYKVDYTREAMKAIRKMDPSIRTMILEWIDKNLENCENPRIHGKPLKEWIDKNLENCENPRIHGKPLKGNKKGVWRYRVGDYRIFAQIKDGVLLILILEVDHRSTAYDR